jgi:hypothetical protein
MLNAERTPLKVENGGEGEGREVEEGDKEEEELKQRGDDKGAEE